MLFFFSFPSLLIGLNYFELMRWCDELYNSGSGGLLAVATGKVLSRMCELPLLPPPRFPRCLFWWLKSVCVCMYLFRQFISCSYTQRESSYGSLCSVNVPVKRRRQTGGNVLFPVVTLMVVVVWMYFLSLRVLCTCCECLLIDWCADHVTKLMNLMRRERESELVVHCPTRRSLFEDNCQLLSVRTLSACARVFLNHESHWFAFAISGNITVKY